jgi:hypothetical protein
VRPGVFEGTGYRCKLKVKIPDKSGLQSIALDGSTTPILKVRLAARIKKVLAAAKERKLNGIGVMARPEADVGLLPLYQVLHRLEPDQGWLEKALVTLAHTLHHALSQPQNVWWGFASPGQNWRFVFEKTENSLIQDFENSPQLEKPAMGKLLPLVREYLVIAEGLGGQSFSKKLSSLQLKPLPDHLPHPEWIHSRDIPEWPLSDKKKKEKLGRVLLSTMNSWQDTAWNMFQWGGKILSGKPQPLGTPKDQFLQIIALDRVSADFAEVAYLDRVFGDSADNFLSALAGYSRFEHYQEIWSGHVSYGHAHVPNALAVNDQEHLGNWAAMLKRENVYFKFGINQMLVKMALKDGISKIAPLRKSDTGYAKAEYLAIQGLLEKNSALVDEGVAGMLTSYHKNDYAVWRGQRLSEICVPAVAIQRAAIRSGMKIKIPADRPNDPELVQIKDPTEARLPFCLYPGIETILNHQGLKWPSLLLDEAIITINAQPITTITE